MRNKADNPDRPLKVVLLGACMLPNLGGQALYLSIAEALSKWGGEVDITLLSKYPDQDYTACGTYGWKMIPFTTARQILCSLPQSLLYGAVKSTGLADCKKACRSIAPYYENDVVVDMSGISFSDDRPLSGLVINCLWLIPALATGIPVVKTAQSMGPFRRFTVRTTARFFLNRVYRLVARGDVSAELVQELLPDKSVINLPDVAFLLQSSDDRDVDYALNLSGHNPDIPYCAVGPSRVLAEMSGTPGLENEYVRFMAKIVDSIVTLHGYSVLLIPHEVDTRRDRDDDLSICSLVYAQCSCKDQVKILHGVYDARLTKGIASKASFGVFSRYHLLVAALSTATPAVALGWGHKYRELMSIMGQERFAATYSDHTSEYFNALINELVSELDSTRSVLENRLPGVIKGAGRNVQFVLEAAGITAKTP